MVKLGATCANDGGAIYQNELPANVSKSELIQNGRYVTQVFPLLLNEPNLKEGSHGQPRAATE